MKKDNSQTRWQKREKKALLKQEQDASGMTWYDRLNFYVRDFNFTAEINKIFSSTKENYTGKKKGFTLIEVSVCCALILILATISLPIYLSILHKGKDALQSVIDMTAAGK